MKKEFMKGVLSFLIISIFFSCASSPHGDLQDNRPSVSAAPPPARVLLRTEGDFDINNIPESGTELYFIGTSLPYDTASSTRDDARENARNQVLLYYGQVIERQSVSRATTSGNTRNTLETYINREDELKTYAQNVVSEVGTTKYYTEVYLNSENKEEYVVYTLCQVSRQKVEDEIANFSKNTSERYVGLFPHADNVKSAMEAYTLIMRSLEQNPLHRATAYYDSPSGRVGVYDYAALQIGALANSLNFAAMDSMTIEKNETLHTKVSLSSAQIPHVGPMNVQVRVSGMNNTAPVVQYTVGTDNSFALSIHTARLEPGRYNVQLTLLLEEMSRSISKNLQGGFSFEVTPNTPPTAGIRFSGDIPETWSRQTIINGLRSAVQSLDIPLSINENTVETSEYQFEIHIKRGTSAVYNMEIIKTDVSIIFKQEDRPLFNSAAYTVTETTDKLAAERIAQRIMNDERFLQQVQAIMQEEK